MEWFEAGHPLPNDGSVAGARRAIEVARGVGEGELLVVLLSGGGSALMALPAEGVTLEDKQATAYMLMAQGADITELNTVRKHLSAVQGGRLAVAAGGRVMTLVVSDVVGDDLSVIASGPTVPDESTYAMHMIAGEARTIEGRLSKGPWIVGDKPGAADYMIFPGIQLLLRALALPEARELSSRFLPVDANYPALGRWLQRIEALPGYERTYPPHWRVAS